MTLLANPPLPRPSLPRALRSPYATMHAVREGAFRYGYRVTVCGQIAERGWDQRVRHAAIDCGTCLRVLGGR